jgi:hypothetical protein
VCERRPFAWSTAPDGRPRLVWQSRLSVTPRGAPATTLTCEHRCYRIQPTHRSNRLVLGQKGPTTRSPLGSDAAPMADAVLPFRVLYITTRRCRNTGFSAVRLTVEMRVLTEVSTTPSATARAAAWPRRRPIAGGILAVYCSPYRRVPAECDIDMRLHFPTRTGAGKLSLYLCRRRSLSLNTCSLGTFSVSRYLKRLSVPLVSLGTLCLSVPLVSSVPFTGASKLSLYLCLRRPLCLSVGKLTGNLPPNDGPPTRRADDPLSIHSAADPTVNTG